MCKMFYGLAVLQIGTILINLCELYIKHPEYVVEISLLGIGIFFGLGVFFKICQKKFR